MAEQTFEDRLQRLAGELHKRAVGVSVDKLADIFDRQRAFNALLREKGCDMSVYGVEDLAERTRITKEIFIAIVTELVEILGELNWKSWKQPDPAKPDVPSVKVEIVDLQHYVVSLSILWGMDSDELHELFAQKNVENVRRQNEGY